MKKTLINKVYVEGVLYQHELELKTSGPNSSRPGTEYITGTLHVATDNEMLNIVPIHYTYVTATTSTGKPNSNFNILKDIIEKKYACYVDDNTANVKLRVDSAIGLNEFFSDREGKEELVSVKRNEGGFIHIISGALSEIENIRNTFDVDMIITGVRRLEAVPERGYAEKVIIKGAIFDFKKSLLPIELSATIPAAMNYFENLEPSSSNPVFTRVKGNIISKTVIRTVTEEGAFGEPTVRQVRNSEKDYVITWAAPDVYDWDDPSTMLASELKEAMQNRETYLAALKTRNDEYNASRQTATAKVNTAPAAGGFDF